MHYRIARWDEVFTSHATGRLRHMSWVKLPTKIGVAARRIGALPRGTEIFGAFVLMVEIAANSPERGTLTDARGPLLASDLALLTGFSARSFEAAFEVLAAPGIGWLERVGEPEETVPDSASDVGVGYPGDLAEAFELTPERYAEQRASFIAVIARIVRAVDAATSPVGSSAFPRRVVNALESMVELAAEKQKHCRTPIAAWQAEMNKRFPKQEAVT